MKQIPLSNSELFALVDDEDFDIVNQYNWCYHLGYAYGSVNKKSVFLHRFILNLKHGDKKQVDHINNNGLDDQKHNLRICTPQQNISNRRKPSGYTSIFKGVDWYKSNQKWRAKIKINYKHISIGFFNDEIMAAKAYDIYANKYFGEFARLNFPDELNDGTVVLQEKKAKTSKYYGVSFRQDIKKWRVRVNKKYYGIFNTELEAAQKANEVLRETTI